MRRIVFQIILMVLCLSAHAQIVTNVRAEQKGVDIVISYFLESDSLSEVALFLSLDNGLSWSKALDNVSGDVGKVINSGEKQIVWSVLENRLQLLGDSIKFKVDASGRKYFEPEMVLVEGGAFQMGSYKGDADESPVHNVALSTFYIGKFEITQSQWDAIMGNNPSSFSDCHNCPVEQVSFEDIRVFIQNLNSKTGKSYRLPTEAEWEYAAKGGRKIKGYVYCEYSGSNYLDSVSWNSENSARKTHPVGLLKPNELGIFDMSGNVKEWCSDWYGNYKFESVTNPHGSAANSTSRVLRGGGWNSQSEDCRVTARTGTFPINWNNDYGFRLVLPAVR